MKNRHLAENLISGLCPDPVLEVAGSGVHGWVRSQTTTDTPGCDTSNLP